MSRKRMRIGPMHRSSAEVRHRVVQVGVDYLTAVGLDDRAQDSLRDLADAIIQDQHELGNQLRAWAWRGYVGAICGDVAYGRRADSVIVRVAAEAADMWAPQLVAAGARPSRIDLAVTMQLDRDVPDAARTAYDTLRAAYADTRCRRSLSLIQSADSGDTLYIGQRTSPVFCRVYDKWRQSGYSWPANTWRYEAELKGTAARSAVAQLCEQGWTRSCVRTIAWHAFSAGGLSPVWTPSEDIDWRPYPRPVTDAERTLGWLRTTVAPAIDHLQSHYPLDAILEALGVAVSDVEDSELDSPT